MNNKVVLLHNKISKNPTVDELDVLEQAEIVEKSLIELGYSTERVAFSFDIADAVSKLSEIKPTFVFNLFEGLENDGQLIHLAPTILDYLKIPYTGCTKEAIFLTSDKVITKKILAANNIPTLEWVTIYDEEDNVFVAGERYILKAVWEDASICLEEDSVVLPESKEHLITLIKNQNNKYQKEFFAERYLHGTDISTPLLAGKILPSRKLLYTNHPENRVRVSGYKAKWEKDTEEYINTIITFDIPDSEKFFIKHIEEISLDCWEKFGLNGYARVDCRVDKQGNPFVLEINPNPCISDDSLYYDSLEVAGISYTEAIREIVKDIHYIYN